MVSVKRFEDLEVWQKARILSREIYLITNEKDLNRDFGLKDQIRNSSGSVMDNIAEGFERGGKKEFVQFLSFAKASAGEVRSQLYRIIDQNYITEKKFNELFDLSNQISKMISGLMEYLKKSDFKGTKYK